MSRTIALVAGEDSGDQLGAALVSSMRKRFPGYRFVGIGGERMRGAGMECWWDCSELAVFGLFEVFNHVFRIWSLRKDLTRRLIDLKPDVFIGIDAPDFNLGLERKLRKAGIRTVQYVSPTVWAWRAWRTEKIKRSADLVLCLFPFEPEFLAAHGIRGAFVGHPMADQIDAIDDSGPARDALGLQRGRPVFALLPGSRRGEVERLTAPMLGAAKKLKAGFAGAQFVTALANAGAAEVFKAGIDSDLHGDVITVDGRVREVIAAADVVICASGTVTLETMLINRPMVVTYRLSPATYQFARVTGLVKAKQFSLPNILAGRALVPELIQQQASPARIANETGKWMHDHARRDQLKLQFSAIHETLRCNASERAADAVSEMLRDGQ